MCASACICPLRSLDVMSPDYFFLQSVKRSAIRVTLFHSSCYTIPLNLRLPAQSARDELSPLMMLPQAYCKLIEAAVFGCVRVIRSSDLHQLGPR